VLEKLTAQLTQGDSLTAAQVPLAIAQLIDEQVPAGTKAGFLTALARKGETADEILGFARELRSLAVKPPLAPETRAGEILDVCGTGGDHLNTFNISTTVALVCAAAGVAVAKHGNRAITSRAGSADVLEALGIRIDLSPEQAAESLREHDFAFFFAPKYHPAFKHIGPARKLCAERGQRTIFNFLGPLLNPAQPTAQLIGVPRPELCEPVARVLQALGTRRGLVVSGNVSSDNPQRCLDEFSTLGGNTVAEFYHEHALAQSELNPKLFAAQSATLDDLAGGDREQNAEIVRGILRGEDRGPKREAVLLNCAAALFVASSADTMAEGWAFAAELIDTGAAYRKLQELAEASKT
jgi:anthranilate phosphoribosyltransferase